MVGTSAYIEELRGLQRVSEIEALAWTEGELIDVGREERRAGKGAGIAQWRQNFAGIYGDVPAGFEEDPELLLDWLGVQSSDGGDDIQLVRRTSRAHALPKVEAWCRSMGEITHVDRYHRSLEAAVAWLTIAPLAYGNRSVATILADRILFRGRVSLGGLVAVGLKATGYRLTSRSAFDHRLWLDSVAAAGQYLVSKEASVRLLKHRIDHELGGVRNRQTVEGIVLLALRETWITLPYVMQELRLGKSVAFRAIDRAVQSGLLRELTGQSSYRAYRAAV